MSKNLISVLVLFLLALSSHVMAAKKQKKEKKKGEILHGIVESVEGKTFKLNYRREDREVKIVDRTKVTYISFLGEKEEVKKGYVVRASVDEEGNCSSLYVTLPIPLDKIVPTQAMLKMTPKQLHEFADANGDGELSYVEYAKALYRSAKHGPVGFGKSDKDKSGTLSLKEFEPKLEGIKWYRISRKTAAEWHKEADADSDGVLSEKEFVTVLGSTAHLDVFMKRTDKDKSGDISVEEVDGYIEMVLQGK